jgi:UDPglucose 6-dehydrogenase
VREAYGERIELVKNAYQACQDVDVLVLATEWREYQNPDFAKIKAAMRKPVIVDGRNIWSGYGLIGAGFEYQGIGVKTA